MDAVWGGIAAGTIATVGAIAWRDHFARATIKRTLEETAMGVAAFRRRNTYTGLLSDTFKAVANVTLDMIEKSRAMRDQTMTDMQGMVIPNPALPLDLQDLEKVMANNQGNFIKIIKNTYEHRAQHLAIEQVKHRLWRMKTAAARKAFKSAMVSKGTVAADGTYDEMFDQINGHVMPHLDKFDIKIVSALDNLGVIDASVDVMFRANQFMADHLSEAARHKLHAFADTTTFLHAIPGGFSGIRTIAREFNMVMNGKVSFGNSFEYAAPKIMVKAAGIKVGMILDGLTGGASLGLFTILGSYFSTKFSNQGFEERNRTLKQELRSIEREIRARHREMVHAINGMVHTFEVGFAKQVDTCPHINDEPALHDYVRKMVQANNHGYGEAEEKLAERTAEALATIPPNSRLERLLRIDRHGHIRRLYLAAQREISAHHNETMHSFSMAAQGPPEDGIRFIVDRGHFISSKVDQILDEMENMTEQTAKDYGEHLQDWESQTIQCREDGNKRIQAGAERENERFERFVEDQEDRRSTIIDEIDMNNCRMGHGPTFT